MAIDAITNMPYPSRTRTTSSRRRSLALLLRCLPLVLGPVLALSGLSSRELALAGVAVFSMLVLFAFRANILNLWTAFAAPWILILLLSSIEISYYSRPIEKETIFLIWMALAIAAPILRPWELFATPPTQKFLINKRRYWCFFALLLALSFLNVALAGYVPLLRALSGEDSGYMNFGVKGLYGFFNAYANAFGVTAFYLWMTKGDRAYKFGFFSVLLIFIGFVTRQNILSLIVECFVVYNIVRSRLRWTTIAGISLLLATGFSALGNLRIQSDIFELAEIKIEYRSLPDAFFWLYSYCYFNVLNLDNAVTSLLAPMYDGSSLAQLIPSFLRPTVGDSSSILEIPSFTVSSFITPLYLDFGLFGLLIFVFCFSLLGEWYRRNAFKTSHYNATVGYSCIFFCFAFSFFVNFWFYLPIIFQLVFFAVFSRTLFLSKKKPRPLPRVLSFANK